MSYPIIFPLRHRLRHRNPEDVRKIATVNGYRQHGTGTNPYANSCLRGTSEIWFKLAGRGYAIVRIDAQGHANLQDRGGNDYTIGGVGSGAHGSVPHYHKEWIEAGYFQQYLRGYVPQVVRYNDEGDPITGAMTDEKARTAHIKR